jgi:hypothetical protein
MKILCSSCNHPINRSKEDYVSSTKIKYIKAGKNGSRPTKESDTQFYHLNCKTIVKGRED